MTSKNTKDRITHCIQAGYSCLYAVTHEEDRVTQEIIDIAEKLNYAVWAWNNSSGLRSARGTNIDKTNDPLPAIAAFVNHTKNVAGDAQGDPVRNKSIVMLHDMHAFLRHPVPMLIRKLKEAINIGRATNRHLIIIGCEKVIPPELEKDITVVEFNLPSRAELRASAVAMAKSAKIEVDDNGEMEALVDAGSGMTISEFNDGCALAKVETGKFDAKIVQAIKSDKVKAGGLLEVVDTGVTLDDIGGLEVFKDEVYAMRNLFTKEAEEYGLDNPRPILCVGQPGCAKSMSSEAMKNVFNKPLLRLEAGRLFGSLVGESESNWRKAFALAKAIAPAVVHVDEVDGLFAGMGSSGRTDGGTTMRVVKCILQDLQFNSKGLFFIFTANDIDGLPDPLIDRCDVWNFELPHVVEREQIWKIHIKKRGRKVSKFDIDRFAMETEGFSGRQIEQAWLKAMRNAFNDKGREVNDKDVLAVLKEFVPTATTMKHQIEARRKRLENCAKLASAPPPSTMEKLKKKLKAIETQAVAVAETIT